MLHAWQLGLTHPQSGKFMTFESPIPDDMEELIKKLKAHGA
jgi:23S rRNA pseudouridine1911/1915/1917 synthase